MNNTERKKERKKERKAQQIPIDLSIFNTEIVAFANCIARRQDRGISNRYKEGTGVLVITDDCEEL